MTAFDFLGAAWRLEDIGLTRIILPFILVFSIVYAVLVKSQLFGTTEEEGRKINSIIALALGLIFVMAPYDSLLGYNPIDLLYAFLPGTALLIVAVLVVLIVIGIIVSPTKLEYGKNPLVKWVGGIAAVVLFLMVLATLSPALIPEDYFYWLNDSSTISFIIMIAVFITVIAFVTSGGEGNGETATPPATPPPGGP